jgi:hypothetical protein
LLPKITVKFKPQKGESLLSYLIRLAAKNRIPFLTFMNMFKINQDYYIQKSNVDLLCFYPNTLLDIDALIGVTKASAEEIAACSFHFILKQFSEGKNMGKIRLLSGYVRNKLFFCPDCLIEKPYHRLLWKSDNVTVCLKHNRYLSSCCSHCKREMYYKDIVSILFCPHCSGTLQSLKPAVSLVAEVEHEKQSWIQEQWNFLMEDGVKVEIREVCIRLLYLLNGERSGQLYREGIQEILNTPLELAKLLQHARGTIPQTRTLHISFLFEVLYKVNSSFRYLFEVEVSRPFYDLITSNKSPSSNQLDVLIPIKPSKRNEEKYKNIKRTLEELLMTGEDITIGKVSQILGVGKGSIRNWGCNKIIAEYKQKQKVLKIQQELDEINQKIEDFIEHYRGNITAGEFYRYLGIQRRILWRKAPELTAYIKEELRRLKGR